MNEMREIKSLLPIDLVCQDVVEIIRVDKSIMVESFAINVEDFDENLI